MKAYVLVEAEVGTARSIAGEMSRLEQDDVSLISFDVVTGPYDLIAIVESSDLDALARFVSDQIQGIKGVQRTVTCVS